MKRVLVASDTVIGTRKGEPFHCLLGAERIWRSSVRDVSEQFVETREDEWDAVVINDDAPISIGTVVKNIRACHTPQLIIVVTNVADKMLPSVKKGKDIVCVPRDATEIERVFKELGLKGVS